VVRRILPPLITKRSTSGQPRTKAEDENEKAARQWAAFSFRENSSNEVEPVKTFWKKSYEPLEGVSRNFSEINSFSFNKIQKWSIAAKVLHFETKPTPPGA
jgi:hypothetical protein